MEINIMNIFHVLQLVLLSLIIIGCVLAYRSHKSCMRTIAASAKTRSRSDSNAPSN
jgi:hypothetical protein